MPPLVPWSPVSFGSGRASFPLSPWRLLLALAGLLFAAGDLSSLEILDTQVQIAFGRQVTITVRLRSPQPVQAVYLFIYPEGGTRTYTGAMQRQGESWTLTFSPQQWHLPPFTTVYYWFEVQLVQGGTTRTPSFTFRYQDERYSWVALQQPPFEVFRPVTVSPMLAQEAVNAGYQALLRMQDQWLAPVPNRVQIYLYPSLEALEILLPQAPEWIGAYSYPALAKIFVVTDDLAVLERNIAHETAHVVLHLATQGSLSRLPWWLNEGLASLAEPQLRSEYRRALSQAWVRGTLFPLVDLCTPPPWEPQLAHLAYAQAASFTGFLQQRFGSSQLHALVLAYTQGASCAEGVQQVYNFSLAELESLWYQEVLAFNPEEVSQKLPVWWLGVSLIVLSGLAFTGAWWWIRHLT